MFKDDKEEVKERVKCEHRFWVNSKTKSEQCLKCKEVVGTEK